MKPSMGQRFASGGEEHTIEFGEKVGKTAQRGDVYGLVGPLGAGKTAFAKGFAMGMGISPEEYVNSPTFTLLNTYRTTRIPMRHFDMYRIEDEADLDHTGFDDDISEQGYVTIVEWADKVAAAMPSDTIWIYFEYLGETSRGIKICRGD